MWELGRDDWVSLMKLVSNQHEPDVNINIPPWLPSLFTQGSVCSPETGQTSMKITQEKDLDGTNTDLDNQERRRRCSYTCQVIRFLQPQPAAAWLR